MQGCSVSRTDLILKLKKAHRKPLWLNFNIRFMNASAFFSDEEKKRLKEAITKYFESNSEVFKLSIAGYKKHYSWSRFAQLLAKFFETV